MLLRDAYRNAAAELEDDTGLDVPGAEWSPHLVTPIRLLARRREVKVANLGHGQPYEIP